MKRSSDPHYRHRLAERDHAATGISRAQGQIIAYHEAL